MAQLATLLGVSRSHGLNPPRWTLSVRYMRRQFLTVKIDPQSLRKRSGEGPRQGWHIGQWLRTVPMIGSSKARASVDTGVGVT